MTAARKDRFWIIGGIVIALVLAAVSWFFVIGPKLDDANSIRSQTATAAAQNDILQVKVNKLRADSAGLPGLMKSLAALHTQLPTTLDLDEFTRQLTSQAADAQVTVTSIVVGAPTVVTPPPAASAAPAPAGQSGTSGDAASNPDGSSTDGSSAGTDQTPGSDASTTAAAPAPAPSSATKNLYAVPVTVAADGPIADQQKLLAAIQTQGPRGALVSSVQFAPGTDTSTTLDTAKGGTVKGAIAATGKDASVAGRGAGPVTMTLQLTVFVAPQSPADENALRKQLGG